MIIESDPVSTEKMSMKSNALSIKEKIGYGMGDAGCNMIGGAIMLFLNYFYTDIFGLTPALVGILLLSVRVLDAVTDPIMGAIADRTQSRWGASAPGCCGSPALCAVQRADVHHPRVEL